MHYIQVKSRITDEIYRQRINPSDSLISIRQAANSLIKEYDIKSPIVSIVGHLSNGKEVGMTLSMTIRTSFVSTV